MGSTRSLTAIVGNGNLVRKVVFPCELLPLTPILVASTVYVVGSLVLVVVGLLVVSLVVGGNALLQPLRGVRDRIRATKRMELAWCRERLRSARSDLAAGQVRGDLQELVTWESRIESINEWQIDPSTFTRFAFYLLIPLGSWAGAAVVERVIDAVLE